MATDVTAGDVEPGDERYFVTFVHNHPTLKEYDTVVMREIGPPGSDMVLIRISDHTIHALKGEHDQYIHLRKVNDG